MHSFVNSTIVGKCYAVCRLEEVAITVECYYWNAYGVERLSHHNIR